MAESVADSRLESSRARIGATVDRYTLVGLLGHGGMGAVYEARHATLSRRFAIKFLLPELAANRDVLRRFENEAKAAGGLEHPNVAAVTDFGRASDGAPYIVMEYLHGEDCAKLLRRNGPLPARRAVNIVLQACRGLAVAHRAGIVHRDLKPENLFLTDAGDGSDLVKVLDFGIAKLRIADASVITGTGATFGTAFYMSPEQARGAGDVDARTDVWSLGVVLYELLSGCRPFQGEQFLHIIHQILSTDATPLATLRPGLPAALVATVERAMAKDLATRVPSVTALANALSPFAGGQTGAEAQVSLGALAATAATPATGIGPAAIVDEPPVRFTARPAEAPRPRGKLLVAAAVLAALGIGAAVALTRGPAAPRTAEAVPAAAPRAAPAPPPSAVAAPAPLPPAVAPLPPASEQSERRSDRRVMRPAAHRSAPVAAPAALPEAPKPLPPAASPPPRRALDIDKDNPYGP